MLFYSYLGDGGSEWFSFKNVDLNIKQVGSYRDRNVWLKWGKWRGLEWIESFNYKQGCTLHSNPFKYWMGPGPGQCGELENSKYYCCIPVVLITLFAIWKKQWEGMQWRQLHVIVITSRLINEKYWCVGVSLLIINVHSVQFLKTPGEPSAKNSYFHFHLNT